jgi:prepilin-type N-terminal cleavage/methylation domain-containing protein
MLRNQKGFTLVEIIAVLAIMGVILSIGVYKVIGGTSIKAEESVLISVIISLNEKELEAWTNLKLDVGWTSDEEVYNNLKILDYVWQSKDQDGGIIMIRDKAFHLKRIRSVKNTYGKWEASNG